MEVTIEDYISDIITVLNLRRFYTQRIIKLIMVRTLKEGIMEHKLCWHSIELIGKVTWIIITQTRIHGISIMSHEMCWHSIWTHIKGEMTHELCLCSKNRRHHLIKSKGQVKQYDRTSERQDLITTQKLTNYMQNLTTARSYKQEQKRYFHKRRKSEINFWKKKIVKPTKKRKWPVLRAPWNPRRGGFTT